tara:strand:- start:1567 stop:2025 length:459 start_codon:yes stop_codon:yes gene_type:complete
MNFPHQIKKILIVCKANFCRSPVAMATLKDMLGPDYEVSSRGMINFFKNSMDPRSLKFLESKNIKPFFHTPRILSRRDVQNFDLIILLDFEVYELFTKKYKTFSNKAFIFNCLDDTVITADPVKYDEEKYFQIMNNIHDLCKKWADNIHKVN